MNRDKFKDLEFLQERMSRIFDEAVLRYMSSSAGVFTGSWSPPVDIYETTDAVVLKGELAGVDADDIDIEVTGQSLVLRGERRSGKKPCEENFHRMERMYGRFQRVFALPSTVDRQAITASLRNGVLEIRMPKSERDSGRPIKVALESE